MDKTLVVVLISAMTFSAAVGLACNKCSTTTAYYDVSGSFQHCYNNLADTTVTKSDPCPTPATGMTAYCETKLTLKDGLWIGVDRKCMAAASVPSTECVTTFSSGTDREETICTQGCTTDNCNTVTTTDFKQCPSDCTSSNQGSCNYFTGACECKTGYSGADCNTAVAATFRSCLQCDEETDSTCATKTTGGVNCASSDNMYCTVSKTSMFDKEGTFIRSRVTRGCTIAPNYNDHCAFTTSADGTLTGNTEYTCTTTCGTNDCNTQVPDGETTGSETRALYCVQCEGSDDHTGCGTSEERTACPNGEGYCYSVATYFTANGTRPDSSDAPLYRFGSVQRGCASAAVEKRCNSTTVANTNVQKISCQESCQEDGCNTGWPNRPKCVRCFSDSGTDYDDGYNRCVFNPAPPSACMQPNQEYCFLNSYGRSGYLTSDLTADRNGYTRTMNRGCTELYRETKCANIDVNGMTFRECNVSCTTDGCNQGNNSGRLVSNMILFSLPALLGFILQCFFQ